MPFAPSGMLLESPAFEADSPIPLKYTGEGEDISPSLSWKNPPENTQSFVLICHDPDAPLVSPSGSQGFVHWVLYGIPETVSRLQENTDLFIRGKNDMGNLGYNGPMPPGGHGVHRYYFWIIALSNNSDHEPGLTMQELLKKIEPDIIGMNRLVGTYQRN